MVLYLEQLETHALEEQDQQRAVEDSWYSILINSEDDTKVDYNRI